jgi:hypothetical protein
MLETSMANATRLRIERQFRLYDEFADEILVECPNCRRCARAFKPCWDQRKRKYRTGMSCLHCSLQHEFVSDWDYWNSLPLWLKTRSCDEVLWALNSRHLVALQEYVSADLREKKLPHASNRHMYFSLPRWITSKKNRPIVLRGLKRLQSRLQAVHV